MNQYNKPDPLDEMLVNEFNKNSSNVWFYSIRSLKRIAIINAIIWLILILALIFWSLYQTYNKTYDIARNQARSLFTKDVIYRHWSASHGGVYVPVSDKTPPNPYLKNIKRRDVTTTDGQTLTLINPAYMTRQAHQLGDELYNFKAHITSLKPERPENKADDWEKNALLKLKQGEIEFFQKTQFLGKEYFRYIQLLRVTQPCLSCHETQGYKVGDVRGGISVSLPAEPFMFSMHQENLTTIISFSLLMMVGWLGIILAYRKVKDFVLIQNLYRSWLIEHSDTQRVLKQIMDISLNDNDLEKILAHVLDKILTVSFFKLSQQGGIFLVKNNELHLTVQKNLSDELVRQCQQVKFGQCLCGRVANSKKILYQSCVDDDHEIRYQGIDDHGHYIVPIVSNNELLGVMVLYLEPGHQESSNEVQFLENVSLSLAQLIMRKQTLEKVNRLAQIVEQSPESIVITNLEAEIEYVNDAFTKNTGYSFAEVVGQNPRILHSGNTSEQTYIEM
ncbi:MAG: DUF3365 domain-containing protein, partial [Gammaproteobacteria bacterium]|nr:DUF3365 domain-containing protein [Gammaproteobacteria bacterium]